MHEKEIWDQIVDSKSIRFLSAAWDNISRTHRNNNNGLPAWADPTK
jgi:hypothetical protein